MAGRRRLRILTLLTGSGAPEVGARQLCEVSAELTGSSGAGIMLMTGDGPRGSLCTTNQVSDLIEQLQYTLGEGPCVDAHNQDRPVLEADLAHPLVSRWPEFTGPALDAGVRAVFGFPLQVGAVRLGALNLHRDRPGRFTDDQHADALVMADVAAEVILLLQNDAAPGQLATELEAGADFHDVVHQAAGMVAVQLGISVGDALVRLRARAFASDKPLTDLARQIVARTLRLDSW